jgi:hypothetical protein
MHGALPLLIISFTGHSTSGVGDQGQRANAALAAVPIANHWLWTRDTAWLNSTGWPFLSEVSVQVNTTN